MNDGNCSSHGLNAGITSVLDQELIDLEELITIEEQDEPDCVEITDDVKITGPLWKRNDVLELINLYKEAQYLFKSTTCTNRKVWQKIAQKLPPYTWVQCENKFKYIKRRYITKVNNMSVGETGRQRIYCDFFDELDGIFRKSHNLSPPNLASSMTGYRNMRKSQPKPSVSGYETAESISAEATTLTPNLDEESVISKTLKMKRPKKPSVSGYETAESISSEATTLTPNLDEESVISKILKMKRPIVRVATELERKSKMERKERCVSAIERIASAFEKFVDKM